MNFVPKNIRSNHSGARAIRVKCGSTRGCLGCLEKSSVEDKHLHGCKESEYERKNFEIVARTPSFLVTDLLKTIKGEKLFRCARLSFHPEAKKPTRLLVDYTFGNLGNMRFCVSCEEELVFSPTL